ncbi:MAG: hypothetical protein JWM90_1285 [Thermoleophilia bacterium]|nr:hypothetical protein [Thermoleophilia bacterium]
MVAPITGNVRVVAAAVADAAAPKVVGAVADIAAPKLAAEAAGDVAAAAPGLTATPTPPKQGIGTGGWLGLGAGAVGTALTAYNVWRDSVGSQLTKGKVEGIGPVAVALLGGATLVGISQKAFPENAFLRNTARGSGIALLVGGLAGSVLGTFGTSATVDLPSTTQLQAPKRFDEALPAAPAALEGIEVAAAEVIGPDKSLKRVSVYVDPVTASRVADGASLADAIALARAASQGDEQDRSHAVVQTADGAKWIVRLSGDLDQVDGRNYTTGTGNDPLYDPKINRKQAALQAIVGVETRYVFPTGRDSDAPLPEVGPITPVTPQLPGAPTPTTAAGTNS